MAIYFVAVFGLYSLLFITLWLGWRKTFNNRVSLTSKTNFISVVIAVRNEKLNLDKLFQSIAAQNYPSTDFEIIVIDDHSSDGSVEEARKWINHFASLTIASLNENQNGKKAALTLGVNMATGEIIATTDADCVLPVNWLQGINEGLQEKDTNMLIGAVAFQNRKSFFCKLQSIEFASVIGTGMALGSLGKPTMCNGANLSFRKKIFDEVNGYSGNEHIASGDDEFLMRKITDRYPGSVQVLSAEQCIVVTAPQASLSGFIEQRLRWASKWKANSSTFARILAVFMAVIQASWLALLAWGMMGGSIATAIIVLKITGELFFLSSICRSLRMQFNFLAFASLQFLYPVYVLYISIFSQLRNHRWKGRRMKVIGT